MNETLGAARPVADMVRDSSFPVRPSLITISSARRLKPFALSLADQALAVGGTFLANVMLARTQTKEEYGMFALSYSLFTFLSGLHNAAILEPYMVYGSGRYRDRFPEYLRLMARSNAFVSILLTVLLFLACSVLWWTEPRFVSRALVGLALTVGLLLSGAFLRRVFYVQRQPAGAAQTSLVFLVTVAAGIWIAMRAHIFDPFSVFLILGLAWIAGGVLSVRKLAFRKTDRSFLELEPQYWREHWKYAQWVLATAFVFQLTSQGYYWLVAGFLSVKEVAELKAMYILVAPVDQIFIALSFLILPALALRYASTKMKDFFSLQRRYGLGVLATTATFALAVRILGKPLMHVLYAGKFDDLAPLLYVLAFLPMIMGLGDTMNNALKAAERPRFVFYAYLCSGAVTFLVGIPLVVHFGLRGAVYGMLLSAVGYAIALAIGFFFVLNRKVHHPSLS
jgi:O-antigen/teichoic acid export membrane protein